TQMVAHLQQCQICRERLEDYRLLATAMSRLTASSALSFERNPPLEAPATRGISPRLARQRHLTSALSSVAAILLLTTLVAGFWWLSLGRGQNQAAPSVCTSVASPNWKCGILVLNYARQPETLLPLDPRTGKLVAGLQPL